jgi:hypothetical protein
VPHGPPILDKLWHFQVAKEASKLCHDASVLAQLTREFICYAAVPSSRLVVGWYPRSVRCEPVLMMDATREVPLICRRQH